MTTSSRPSLLSLLSLLPLVLLLFAATACSSAARPQVVDPAISSAVDRSGLVTTYRFEETGEIGVVEGTEAWSAVHGDWSSDNGVLRVNTPATTTPAIATVRLSAPDGLVQVTLASLDNQAGLIFRYVNPSNYWYVAAAPDFGSWNVVKIVDDEPAEVGQVGLGPVADNTTIGVVLDDATISILLNGKTFDTIVDETHAGALVAGVTVRANPSSTTATFDDFIALVVDQKDVGS